MPPNSAEVPRALILGGGVAGLAAAYQLAALRPGWQVAVLEGQERLGGLAQAWQLPGFAADLGPHRIYTELPEIERLLPELIEPGRMLTVKRRSQLLLAGHFYEYPVRATELLRELGAVQMAGFAVSAAAGKVQGMLRTPRNFEEAMTAAFGKHAYNLIVAPYARKVWKTEPEELHTDVARVRVSAGGIVQMIRKMMAPGAREKKPTALTQFGYIRGGVHHLVDSLARKCRESGVTLTTGAPVQSVRIESGRVNAVEIGAAAATRMEPGSCFISTLPLPDLAQLLLAGQPRDADSEGARYAASELTYLGMILVGVIVRRAPVTPNSWIYFPEDRFVFNRAYEPRNFDPSMAPDGRSLLVFEVTARWNSSLWQSSDDDLRARVAREASAAGIFTHDEVEETFALRLTHTYPLYTVDYRDQVKKVCRYLKRFPNVISTGRQGLFNHNNMDHSMLMGLRAAEFAAQGGGSAHSWYDSLGQFDHFRIVD